MNTMIEEIRKRIKARMDNTDAAGDYDEYADGQGVGLAAALRIIDEVEKEHPIPSDVQEDKAAMDYYLNLPNSSYGEGGNLLPRSINDAFKAGAEWQRNKPVQENVKEAALAYERSLDYYHFTNDEPGIAYAAGMLAERERLMKDAVEIDTDITINRYTKQHILHISSTDEHIQHLPRGEYKAIIIKKEK